MKFFRLALLLLLLLPAPRARCAEPRWVRFDTEHFGIQFPDQEASAGVSFGKTLEALRGRVLAVIPAAGDAPKVNVLLAPDRASFDQLQPDGRAPEWAVGTANVKTRTIIVYSPRGALDKRLSDEYEKTVLHELSHVYLSDAVQGRHLPRWLNEGVAQLVAGQWTSMDAARLTVTLLLDRLIPLKDLINHWPETESRAKLAYAESLALTNYLQESGRLSPVLENIRAGQTSSEALKSATGASLQTFEKRWLRFLRQKYTWLSILNQGCLWTFMALLLVVGWFLVKLRRKKQYERLDDDLTGPPLPPLRKLRPLRRRGDGDPPIRRVH
ncbi:MAG: hypothetical protein GX444_17280 [Myxococcales bacterium]|nr:hypothetical protein [Myxococcales bacterium]